MLCEIGTHLKETLETATRFVGEHAEANKNSAKDSAYGAKEEALERARRQASFAFTEHRDNCPTCAADG